MDFLQNLVFTLPGIILGLSFHELAHGWVAYKLGDSTPRDQGRLTMNPLKHIDPLGFLFLVLAQFGWAKPVETNTAAFKHPRAGMVAVALAGPLSNLLLAAALAIPTNLFLQSLPAEQILIQPWQLNLAILLESTIRINLGLMVFNLLPLPPLDGSHLWMSWIPDRYGALKFRLYRFGALALFGLLVVSSYFNLPIFRFLSQGVTYLREILGFLVF